MPNKQVIFVCKGNIHRSVIAEYITRKLICDRRISGVLVKSRGLQWYMTYPPSGRNLMDYKQALDGSRTALEEQGIDVSDHVARPLSLQDMERAKLVLVMDRELLRSHRMSVLHLFPEYESKTRLFTELVGEQSDIEDCGEHSSETSYKKTIEQIARILRDGLPQLMAWLDL